MVKFFSFPGAHTSVTYSINPAMVRAIYKAPGIPAQTVVEYGTGEQLTLDAEFSAVATAFQQP